MITSDVFLLRHTCDPDASIATKTGFYCMVLGVGLLVIANAFFKADNHFLFYVNVCFFNLVVLILSIIVVFLVVGRYSSFYCSFGSSSKYFCGNGMNADLNADAYTMPLQITGTTLSAVYSAIQGSLTFTV
eukprot:52657-Hanusia_phi.AAC.8